MIEKLAARVAPESMRSPARVAACLSSGVERGDVDKWEPKNEYGRKLQDPRWQRVRLEVMQRDDFKCTDCGDGDSMLNVHHRWYGAYGRDPWDYPLDSLVTLCWQCHEHETEAIRDTTCDLVMMLKQAGADSYAFGLLCLAFVDEKTLSKDDWDTVFFGLCKIMDSRRRGTDLWSALSTEQKSSGDAQST